LIVVALFIADHNPFSSLGRTRISNTIRRSGPAYQLPELLAKDRDASSTFAGWRMGAFLNITLMALCLLVEIMMLTAAVLSDTVSSDSKYDGVVYRGSCKVSKRWSTIISLLLNVIATLTIGSSNYMMQ